MQARLVEVAREDHGSLRVVDEELPEPGSGQVLLAIEHVAITANTVTYAVTGDSLDYFAFYPTGAEGWARVPAMGHATVVASGVDGVPAGTRTYGWYPIGSHVLVDVEPTAGGLVDVGPHRSEHARIYRQHLPTSRDPLHRDGTEHRDALLRGLFLTSFLADDALAEHHPDVATTVVTSASSKTSVGIAHQRARRGGRVVGVTSSGNVPFVEDLGTYDEVVAYDEAASVTSDGPAALVDVAGDRTTLAALHGALGSDLVHSMAIGRSHWDAERHVEVPPPRPAFFFAPEQAARRSEQWGAEGLLERMAAALHGFVDDSRRWLEVVHGVGTDEVLATWQQVRAGGVPPSTGHVVSVPAP